MIQAGQVERVGVGMTCLEYKFIQNKRVKRNRYGTGTRSGRICMRR